MTFICAEYTKKERDSTVGTAQNVLGYGEYAVENEAQFFL